MFDVRAFPRVGPLTQRLEQGTRNSRKRFCACFTALRSVADARCSAFHIAPGCAELRDFAAKISQTVQNVLESFAVSGNEKGKN